jgi:LPXTG-site transpeptidase (sortase) family protein
VTPGKPQHTDPSPYQQRSLWEAPQWEPIPEPEEPWLPPWRHALRTVLGARVLTLALLTAAMLLGSSYARGVPADSALAARTTPRPQARAVGKLPADEPMSAPPATPAPSPTPSASPAPTRTATDAPTRTPTIAPSATSTATAPPSATPTEDTSLEVTAPTATSATGSAPAPTVVYPIGPPPVRLVIPSIGVDIPVITVGTVRHTAGGQTYEVWDTVADAGAYHKMSAPPGYVGNTVINGHRDILGKVFADLDKVLVGDPITLFTENHEFTYTVSEVLVVPEKHASPEQRAENQRLIGYIPEDRLTLVTCTPYGTNLNRLLVIARPAGQPQN